MLAVIWVVHSQIYVFIQKENIKRTSFEIEAFARGMWSEKSNFTLSLTV